MQQFSQRLERALFASSKKEKITRIVIGAMIYDVNNFSILLLKRHPSDFMPELEELPSGKRRPNETLMMALEREVSEETGLLIEKVYGYLGSFDYFSRNGILTRQFNFLVQVKDFEEIVLDEHEHIAYRWHDIRQAEGVTNMIRNLMQKIQESPYFRKK